MEVKIGKIPEWTEKDFEIIREYEKMKKEGTLKEYVFIVKDEMPTNNK